MASTGSGGTARVRWPRLRAVAAGMAVFTALVVVVPPAVAEPTGAEAGPAAAIYPTPKSVLPLGSGFALTPVVGLVRSADTDTAALRVVRDLLQRNGVSRIVESVETDPGTPVTVWLNGSGAARSGLDALGVGTAAGLRPESYLLAITRGERGRGHVVLSGVDGAGTFYAAQSLRQLVGTRGGRPWLPGVLVRDEPAMAIRGTIEGFYGTPWSHQDRLDQLDFYGTNKLNIYVYAPKDDPYHREKWREPYPLAELARLKELVDRATANHVRFTFALSPGLSVCYSSDADFLALRAKFEVLHQAGVRQFNVALDDIDYGRWNCAADEAKFGKGSGGAAGAAQSYLLNRVQREFIAAHPDTARLQMVPTEYYNVAESPYKKALREQLDPTVLVEWTGIGVIAHQITKAEAAQAKQVFGHEILIWDNYPVNDYPPVWGRLLLAPYLNREAGLSAGLAGIHANPMNQAAASKIALFTVADFLWNDSAYDPQRSWAASLRALAGGHERTAAALRTFADLNYWNPDIHRVQAPEFGAAVKRFWDDYRRGDPGALRRIGSTVDSVAAAPAAIRGGVADRGFLADAERWLDATALWGKAMQAGVDILAAIRSGDGARALAKRREATGLITAAGKITDPNSYAQPDRGKTPVRIGDGVVDRFIQDTFTEHDRWLGTARPTNVALGGTATQSSTLTAWGGPYPASWAIDANVGNMIHTDCKDIVTCAEGTEPHAWWQVDLGRQVAVDEVRLWNRRDCCGWRTRDYWLFLSDKPFTSTDPDETAAQPGVWSSRQAEEAGYPSELPVGATGRYLRVQLNGPDPLNLAEVEVLGRTAVTDPLTVSGGPEPAAGSALARAADGNIDSLYVAARAPQAGEALVFTAAASRRVERVIVVQEGAAKASVQARLPDGRWRTLGELSADYTELRVRALQTDAVRLVWAAGSPAPRLQELILR